MVVEAVPLGLPKTPSTRRAARDHKDAARRTVDLVLDRQRLGPAERRFAEPRRQVLVPFYDTKPTSSRVHARLQRVRHIEGPAPVLDAPRLAVLRPHDVDERSRRPALNFEILLQSSGEVALPRRDRASSPI